MKVLVTGSAGFIGMHCVERLLARGDDVVGVDNLNDYYDVTLKDARLARIAGHEAFHFHCVAVEDKDAMAGIFADEKPDRVIHLAAQAIALTAYDIAGKTSITNPLTPPSSA